MKETAVVSQNHFPSLHRPELQLSFNFIMKNKQTASSLKSIPLLCFLRDG